LRSLLLRFDILAILDLEVQIEPKTFFPDDFAKRFSNLIEAARRVRRMMEYRNDLPVRIE
jgi:hypothetical protein